MKKIVLLLASIILFAVASFAQNEHLNFLGIPLDGTINQFESKLLNKGYTKGDNLGSTECRVYNGSFIGKAATIVVYYDAHTKIVFAGKAYFSDLSERMAKDRYTELKNLLLKKYPNAYTDEYEEDGLPNFELGVDNGIMIVYMNKHETGYGDYVYTTLVQYSDNINRELHKNSIMNDL